MTMPYKCSVNRLTGDPPRRRSDDVTNRMDTELPKYVCTDTTTRFLLRYSHTPRNLKKQKTTTSDLYIAF